MSIIESVILRLALLPLALWTCTSVYAQGYYQNAQQYDQSYDNGNYRYNRYNQYNQPNQYQPQYSQYNQPIQYQPQYNQPNQYQPQYQNDRGNPYDRAQERSRADNTPQRPPTIMGYPVPPARQPQYQQSQYNPGQYNQGYNPGRAGYYSEEQRPLRPPANATLDEDDAQRTSFFRKAWDFLGSGVIYVGAGVGRTSYTKGGTITDSNSTGRKVYFGFRLNPTWSLEGSYFDFGRFRGSFTTGDGSYYENATYQVKAFQYGIRGRLPLDDRFTLSAKLGGFKSQTNINGSNTLSNADVNQLENSMSYGIGADWAYSKNLALRLELDYLGSAKSSRVRLLSVGAEYLLE